MCVRLHIRERCFCSEQTVTDRGPRHTTAAVAGAAAAALPSSFVFVRSRTHYFKSIFIQRWQSVYDPMCARSQTFIIRYISSTATSKIVYSFLHFASLLFFSPLSFRSFHSFLLFFSLFHLRCTTKTIAAHIFIIGRSCGGGGSSDDDGNVRCRACDVYTQYRNDARKKTRRRRKNIVYIQLYNLCYIWWYSNRVRYRESAVQL